MMFLKCLSVAPLMLTIRPKNVEIKTDKQMFICPEITGLTVGFVIKAFSKCSKQSNFIASQIILFCKTLCTKSSQPVKHQPNLKHDRLIAISLYLLDKSGKRLLGDRFLQNSIYYTVTLVGVNCKVLYCSIFINLSWTYISHGVKTFYWPRLTTPSLANRDM